MPTLPDEAQVWCLAYDRPLPADVRARAEERLRAFLASWHCHGHPVTAELAVLHERLLVVGAWLAEERVSGCAIDGLTGALGEVAREGGFGWHDPLHIAYLDAEGAFQLAGRAAFKQQARAGAVDAGTVVFDLGVSTLGAVRRGGLTAAAGQAWHRALLPAETAA